MTSSECSTKRTFLSRGMTRIGISVDDPTVDSGKRLAVGTGLAGVAVTTRLPVVLRWSRYSNCQFHLTRRPRR